MINTIREELENLYRFNKPVDETLDSILKAVEKERIRKIRIFVPILILTSTLFFFSGLILAWASMKPFWFDKGFETCQGIKSDILVEELIKGNKMGKYTFEKTGKISTYKIIKEK